jgi:hypothetical protein
MTATAETQKASRSTGRWRWRVRVLAALASAVLTLGGCFTDGGGGFGPVPTISLQPQISTLGVGATQQFTATVSDDNGYSPAWNLFQPFLSAAPSPAISNSGMGTIGQDGLYTAPATPPVFDYGGGVGLQGAVGVNVAAQQRTGQSTVVNASSGETVVITAGVVTAGFVNPLAVTVPLGGTYRFQPYAVGAVNRAYTLQVQGITGGSTTYGTITQDNVNAGLYAAPAAMPMTGKTVTVTVVSVADPTKTANATVTLQ